MADAREDIPQAVAVEGHRWAPGLVWIIPLVAVLVGAWLVVQNLLDRGPTITIEFKTAEGLEAGKTRIRFKDVEIGLVKAIELSENRQRVVVTAQLDKGVADLLVEDTRFWAVRPRISAQGVSGLGTLLSGAYITLDPGNREKRRRDFVALEQPPQITSEDPGREYILLAESLGSLELGVPVYFREVAVGEVVATELNKDGAGVAIRVFVRAPYDQYVTTNTRFWNVSGINVSLGAGGLQVRTESLLSLLIGGIAFQAPPNQPVAPAADPRAFFTLFATRDAAMKVPEGVEERFVVPFTQSVRGLSVGAPVEFRGVTVGEVLRIGTEFDAATYRFVQPVEIGIYPERLRARSADKGAALPPPSSDEERLQRAKTFVERGFRAQLRSGSLITGQAYIALDFFPNAPKSKFDPSKRPLEIPAVPGPFENIEEKVASIVEKLDRVQYEQIGADARKALASLDQTLRDASALVKRADAESVPALNAALQEATRTLERAQGALAADSPVQTDLRETLREVTRAAASIRALADMLERQPQSLIRGKPPEEGN